MKNTLIALLTLSSLGLQAKCLDNITNQVTELEKEVVSVPTSIGMSTGAFAGLKLGLALGGGAGALSATSMVAGGVLVDKLYEDEIAINNKVKDGKNTIQLIKEAQVHQGELLNAMLDYLVENGYGQYSYNMLINEILKMNENGELCTEDDFLTPHEIYEVLKERNL